jgi:beta-glucosidase
VEDLLARMTLDEKIGQMIQIEHPYIAPADVSKYFIGSVLSGGNGLSDNSPAAWRKLVEGYLSAALETRLGIPLLYGVDATHGHAHIYGATIFPQEAGLGATRDAGLVEKIGRATAEEMAATSEELAAQSEELQTSISFCKVDGGSMKSSQKSAAKQQSRPAASSAYTPAPARKQNSVAHQQARAKGFALDLNHGGPDSGDADFRESA